MQENPTGERIRVRGSVQGVGFRPTVWRLAQQFHLCGKVYNDGAGVLIEIWGDATTRDAFCRALILQLPLLAVIDDWERTPLVSALIPTQFQIAPSQLGGATTAVSPDAATCPACDTEIRTASERRYRYPFTNCIHCGPRYSIIQRIPYDRANTTMAQFPLCDACHREYHNPADRRFHAQAITCPACGPSLSLLDRNGVVIPSLPGCDLIQMAASRITAGEIVAIKGIGGFHLACDASNESAVAELRRRKRRQRKAFALMARDLDMVRHYAWFNSMEAGLLGSYQAPIVILRARFPNRLLDPLQDNCRVLSTLIAPGQSTLGFMLPYSPLHHLLLAELTVPIVLTSANRSHAPVCFQNNVALETLSDIADVFLVHDREILQRVDDSVLRVDVGKARMLRRARGYAPCPIRLPEGFANTPRILAMGAELKNSFCMLQDGFATLSQHIGDLGDGLTYRDYQENLRLSQVLFQFEAQVVAVDLHPDYRATKKGQALAAEQSIPIVGVQHHHAHIAACMVDAGRALDAPPVLGVVMDGLGYGDDHGLWGGEFLLASYRQYRRLARFVPVPLLGGDQAMREPWRNTFAHLVQAMGWDAVLLRFSATDIVRYLRERPVANLLKMQSGRLHSPLASSCGRLFDAVAAALGVTRELAEYEGQAALELECLAEQALQSNAPAPEAYPVEIQLNQSMDLLELCWGPLWSALLQDLLDQEDVALMAAKFHLAVVNGIVAVTQRLCRQHGVKTVVLSGGVFQNRILLKRVYTDLLALNLEVLLPERIPANDGGISIGQAVVAAAMLRVTNIVIGER